MVDAKAASKNQCSAKSFQTHDDQQKVTVFGAGAIGVCVALYLQRDDFTVTLIDRDEPASGCSFGNAGLIQCTSVVPVATPGIVRQVPRMLLDKSQPLFIQWRYLPSLSPYLLRFLGEARNNRVAANAWALASIVPASYEACRPLIAAAGIEEMVKPSGELHVFETDDAFRDAQANFEMRRAHGAPVDTLDADAVRQLEPSLTRSVRHGLFLLVVIRRRTLSGLSTPWRSISQRTAVPS